MNGSPPLFLQERPDTCALACLRMILAAFDTTVSETTLVGQVAMEPGGTEIGELERLARSYGLETSIEAATADQLQTHLTAGRFAIVYLNRRIFDLHDIRNRRMAIRESLIHCVVPVRITPASVVFLDPLRPRPQRRSRQRFAAAHGFLGHACVVCGPVAKRSS